MNGESKSSPTGYHRLLEFSYNVIIDTHDANQIIIIIIEQKAFIFKPSLPQSSTAL